MNKDDASKAGSKDTETNKTSKQTDFIRAIIAEDNKNNKHGGRVHTRFPPEPNGYLHIGHAKSICLNFGIAGENEGGLCNLRFDDTNPSKEDQEYIDSIFEDVRWLGFDWEDRLYYASDYFEKLYEFAIQLIKDQKAYVCDLSAEEIRQYRGTLTEPGKDSPYRKRSVEENLDLFQRMKAGEFPDGSRVLRAKIDMKSPNLNMRDPVLYRILRATHHRTGDTWCIYPMYDYTHPVSDSLEGITHSICTLEFEDHRPLYDWSLNELDIFRSRQIEFARLNLTYTVMSKRKLLELVKEGHVSSWDDPRMPTISGLRRRGYTPESIRDFCDRIGVAKNDSIVDIALLEHCVRDDLNEKAPRRMAVLNPLKVVIDNYTKEKTEEFQILNHPGNPEMGTRSVPFGRTLYIERDDFMEDPPKKFFRLAPGREVRLRGAYFITCDKVIKDASTGEITELHCSYDPTTRGGDAPDGRKVKGTIHWVCAERSIEAEMRLYDRLFTVANPGGEKEEKDFKAYLNPDSLKTLPSCRVESSLKTALPGEKFQFERLGYFCVDAKDSSEEHLVFNRTVTLRDSWAKIEKSISPEEKIQVPKPEPEKSPKQKSLHPKLSEITIDDFSRLDLRVGIIREATEVEGSSKLVKLFVDLNEGRNRQIFAGIKSGYANPEELVGQKVIVVANLKPRKMKFGLSEGMLLAGGNEEDLCIATFNGDVKPGEKVS
jgi:glutaminyl-tRNA synthetase